ncbi:50S ribosomal protein L25/general stress protein Ctc [Carnimonas nigrificans]|uniref:50S ribosomal protein L25/general stress protein Ctc n=1 Tax=Carnimonas nigrificans TaxID=64323 RepID=UPI0004707B48|nr:50S ribosomal protein L25/general stress protein Ctc [Carnimonas nigrificans]
MKHDYTLTAVVRTDLGKGASRRLRRANERVAAIVYGGNAEPLPIAIDKTALYKAIEEDSFYSSVININVEGGKPEQVIVRDLQRHPYKPLINHADFQRINANEEITLNVQLHFNNAEEAKGVKEDGGVLNVLHNEVEISALPKNLPEYLELDVAELALGETLHLSDIKTPEGVTLTALAHAEEGDEEANLAVVTVAHPAEEPEEDDEAAAEGEEKPEE